MERGNSALERPKTKKSCEISGHKNKLWGFQSSNNRENTEEFDEFTEEDVWGVAETEAKQSGCYENGNKGNAVSRKGSKEMNIGVNSSRRMKIPRGWNHYDENGSNQMRYQSAPVNIPDWSQILKSESCKQMNKVGDDYRSDDDGDYEEKIPPHEIVAKQLARSQITSFSVHEGAGRTLKGRDLSRVRNAVWTRTGFFG
ncbi:hypothetical protein SUGI_1129630 [Cryptomeria japonica]|uniref:protein S40-5 n=1 Tax=Cryptomeria japonica TaxID=3369 RepID=UPI002414A9DE|nr:protein S40-5 [Cryptomeria japonica]GLJ53040.1 hypothetical protein SUGI_1129630 [Cryptomeria japonica]